MIKILKENEKTSWQIENYVITYKSSHREKQKSSKEDEKSFLKSSWQEQSDVIKYKSFRKRKLKTLITE